MKVSQLMTRECPPVYEETPLREFVQALRESGTSGLPVIDREGHVVGFVSERDVIEAALPGGFELPINSSSLWPEGEQFSEQLRELADAPVRDYMVCEVVKVREDEEDAYVAELMIRKGLKVIPVVDRDGVLVGLIRRIDLLKGLL